MIKSFIINKYISKDFLKTVIIITSGFFCLSMIMNLFEEINFFKDFEIGVLLSFFVTMLIIPNIIYNLFPFIILLSAIWLFYKLIKTDEIIAMKTSGMSNTSIIIMPCIIAFLLGTFFIAALNPITSVLVAKYENIKGSYSKDKDHLAAITANGIWIKEKNNGLTSIIRSSNLKNNNLMNVTIYQFDENYIPVLRIEAKLANIEKTTWVLKDAKINERDENKKDVKILDTLLYESIYDINKIATLYSNLDTVSFWSIKNQIQILQDRGYSIKEMQGKFHKAISFPFFLVSMVLVAGVFTLGKQYKKSNWNYIFIAILACILIYFFNDFSLALGKTEKLPIEISVWMPVIIAFIFSIVGLIHVNQK